MINYPETDRKRALSLLGVARMRQDLVEKVRNCKGCAQRREVMARGMQRIREALK